MGVCDETELVKAEQSIATMMQVYEYGSLHRMAKAFEPLFSPVSCLPGFFDTLPSTHAGHPQAALRLERDH